VISTVLGQVTGQLDKRFLLNAFFPTLLFSLVIALVVTSGTGGVAGAVNHWDEASTAVRVLIVVGWVAVILVVANLVANGTLWIIQLFEGYSPPASWFSRWGQSRQLKRVTRLDDTDPTEAELIQLRFPVNKPRPELKWFDMAPTSLGNVLLSAETYPWRRYGAPAVRLWPRLYTLLPDEIRTALEAARSSMEFLLVVAFFASVFTVPATVYLICIETNIAWILAALLGGSFVAALAYRGAHVPAEIYGDHVRAAFDLHRRKLLVALGVPLPATVEEERRTWDELIRFLDRSEEPRWRYVYPE
jgi:hypothetical protein